MFDQLESAPRIGSPQFAGPAQRELEFGLSPEQLATYHEKGFVILKSVLGLDDIEAYRKSLDNVLNDTRSHDKDLGRDPKYNLRYEITPSKGEDIVWKIDPFSGLSPTLSAITRDKRITDAVASIYDGYDPMLFKDKLIIKPPGTHGSVLHQDYNWWQGFPKSLLTVSIPLDATNRENGCTEMYTGHKRGFLHNTDKAFSYLDEKELENGEHHHLELELGDIAIFSCFTPHRAGSNTSDANRRVFFLSYNDTRDGEFYQSHYQHFRWYRTSHMDESDFQKYYFI